MTKLVCLILFTLVCAICAAPPKKEKRYPPNNYERIPDEQLKHHPKFHLRSNQRADIPLPQTFDARQKWPNCVSIKTIRDQGQCGSCWAVSATSVISDRLCIASGQKTQDFISAIQAASCTRPEFSPMGNCKTGGDPVAVYKYAVMTGLPTGGNYDSNSGCVPYSVPSNGAVPFSCATKCTNTNYPTVIGKDAKILDSYWINYQYSAQEMTQKEIDDAVKKMKVDLVLNGPITATFTVFSDFQGWTKEQGPYRGPGEGAQNKNGHAIKIIGWHRTPEGIPYWLISNSWGADSGDQGIYWIELGRNVCGIEKSPSAPIVSVPNTCASATFCSNPIDYAIRLSPKDQKLPVFLFQGNCTMKVNMKPDGKMTTDGVATPIAKQIVSAPDGPIVAHSYTLSQDSMYLINPKKESGAECVTTVANSKKASCKYVSTSNINPWTLMEYFKGGRVQRFSIDPAELHTVHDDTQGGSIEIDTTLSAYFASLTSMVDVDGNKMTVFGKDKSGKPISGVLAYPDDHGAPFTWVTKPGPIVGMLKC